MSFARLLAVLLLSTLFACDDGPAPDPQGPALPSTSLGESTVGAPFSRSLAASGGTAPLSYSAQGLPAGIALDPQTGALTGSPSSPGSFDITASVTDAAGRSDQRRYPLLVLEAPHFGTASLPPATATVSYAVRIEASGGKAPLAHGLGGGSFPPGLAIDASGTLSGTPSAPGTYSFEISVTDAHGSVRRASFTLEVRHAPPVIDTSELTSAQATRAYRFTFTASGGTSPYSWSKVAGELPPGLALSTSGELSGTPAFGGTFSFTLEVRDANGQAGTQSFSLRVTDALAITPSPPPDAYTDRAYAHALAAVGGRPPYGWALVGGSLPPGISLSTSGQLSGIPSASGGSTFTVSATDADNLSVTKTLSLTTYAPPALAAVPARNAYVSDVINLALSITGGKAPYAFSSAGSLPPGLSLGASSGLLQGPLTTHGSFSFDVTAADANGRTSTRPVSFTIHALPAITSSTLPEGDTGQAYSAQLTATGGQGTLSWSFTGTLPPGLSLSSTGLLSGTPTTAGSTTFTVRVTDAGSRTDSRAMTVSIQGPPTVTTSALTDGYLSSAYAATLTAAGGRSPLTWSIIGSLPPGLSLTSSGILSGIPTSAGSFTFTARVTDSLGRSGSRALSLRVYWPPSVSPSTLSDAYVSEFYDLRLAAMDGKPPYTFSLSSGALPAGLSLAASGQLAGTPAAPGTANFEVTVSDANGRTGRRSFTLAVYSLPTLTTTTLPEARQSQAYAQTLTASGGKPDYFFLLESGSPPAGITLDSDGQLTGTPTGSTSSFTVRVYDVNNRSHARTLTLSVYIPPRITTDSLPDGTLNTPYSVTLGFSGGRGTLSWGYSGTLPPGLSFGSDGSIFGTPTASGTWSFTVTLQDSEGGLDSRVFPLTVRTPAPDEAFTVGHWNIEWFGSDSLGPPRSTSPGGSLDDLQIANARDLLADAGVNLWGLVEMVDTADFQSLKAQLPGYDGFLANDSRVAFGSSYYSAGEQKVGVLYDNRLTFQSASLILTHLDADFAGRPPLRVDFTTSIQGSSSPLTVIVLHMKAFDDQTSYDKRQRAGAALKSYLDSSLPSSRVLVVGDWNDDVDVSITEVAGSPLPSPYANFLAAPNDYSFVTRPLSLAGESSTIDFPDMIDHTLASNEMAADYVPGSAHVLRPTWISDYGGTTSDHYPVLSRYDFGSAPSRTNLNPAGSSPDRRVDGSPY